MPDNFDFSIFYINDDFKNKIKLGLFKDAKIDLYIQDFMQADDFYLETTGNIGKVDIQDNKAVVQVLGIKERLNKTKVRKISNQCQVELGSDITEWSQGCGIDLVDFSVNSTVTGVESSRVFFDTNLQENTLSQIGEAPGDNYFQYGTISFTSGDNVGTTFRVKYYDSVTEKITIFLQPYFPVQIGDNYKITAGCDKSEDHCENKFQNLENRKAGSELLSGLEKYLRKNFGAGK